MSLVSKTVWKNWEQQGRVFMSRSTLNSSSPKMTDIVSGGALNSTD